MTQVTLPRWMRLLRGGAVVLALLVALASYRFLAMPLAMAFTDMAPLIEGARIGFLAHIIAAPIVLALGAFQLMPNLRARRPKLHRVFGRVSVAAMVIGGAGAVMMAPHANGGIVSTLGFGLLALLWMGCALMGVWAVRRRDFAAHRRFMIRGYSLTFAAVVLRLELGGMMGFGMTYVDAIRILSWASWVPLLILAELWLRRAP
ncbi:MAG: DUF2306 domain-containing protein [Maritimibacter sp.]